MISLENFVNRLIKSVKVYFQYSAKLDKDAEEKPLHQSFQEVKTQVKARVPHKEKVRLQDYPKSQALLYRLGFGLVLSILAMALALFVFAGEFRREWINPYSTQLQQSATDISSQVGQFAVGLLGTVGVPPFVLYCVLGFFLVGWLLMLVGLQSAHPVYSTPFVGLFGFQLWTLYSGLTLSGILGVFDPSIHSDLRPILESLPNPAWLVPLGFASAHLVLCLLGWFFQGKRTTTFLLSVGHICLLSLAALGVLLFFPTRMDLMVQLSANQLSTVVLLLFYWYILGHDALDGTVTLGHWYGRLGLQFLRSHWLTTLTLLLLVLGSAPYLTQSIYFALFGGLMLGGFGLILWQWWATRQAPNLFTVNIFLLALLLFVVAPKAMGAFFPKIEQGKELFLLSPVLLYIYTTIWSFYSSGPLFINRATHSLPASARLFLHIGWVMLASNCLLFFVAARDDTFMLLSSQITAEAFLIVGVPFLLYLFLRHPSRVFIHVEGQAPPLSMTFRPSQAGLPKVERPPSQTSPSVSETPDAIGISSPKDAHQVQQHAMAEKQTIAEEFLGDLEIPEVGHTLGGPQHILTESAWDEEDETTLEPVQGRQTSYPQNFSEHSWEDDEPTVLAKTSVDLAEFHASTQIPPNRMETQPTPQEQNPPPLSSSTQSSSLSASTQPWGIYALVLSLCFVVSLQLYRGLAAYNFTQIALHTARGNQALRQNKPFDAIRHYNQAIGFYPNNFKPFALKGMIFEKLGMYDSAIHELKTALKIQPKAVDTWLQIGSMYRRQKKYKQALSSYKSALQLDPSDSFIYRNIGLCYSHMGRHQQALNSIGMALNLMPGTNEFGNTHYPAKAAILIRAGMLKEAVQPLHTALKLNPKDATAYSDFGILYQRLKQPAKALRSLRKAHRIAPSNLHILNQLTSLLSRLAVNQPAFRKEALQALQRTYKSNSQDARVAVRYINGLLAYQQIDLAHKILQNALQWNASHPNLLVMKSRIELRRNQPKQALQTLQQLRKEHPKHDYTLYRLGLFYLQQKQPQQALTHFRTLVQRSPKYNQAWLQIAYILRIQRKYKAAYQAYETILQTNPNAPNALFFKGMLAVQNLRDYRAGFAALHKLLHGKRDPYSSTRILALRLYGIAGIRTQPRQINVSINAYQRILRLTQRKDLGALNNLSILYSSTKQFEQAEATLRSLIQFRPKQLSFRLRLAVLLSKIPAPTKAIQEFQQLARIVKAIPPQLYQTQHRKDLKNFTQPQILRYCAQSIQKLRRTLPK